MTKEQLSDEVKNAMTALTERRKLNKNKLTPNLRTHLIDSIFSKKGIF